LKTRTRIVLLALLGAAVVFLFSCSDLIPVSISDRIDQFVTSLNGDRSATYQNFDSTVGYYSAIKAPATTWDVWFAPADKTFSYTPNPPVTTNPLDVEVTISGTGGASNLYKFVMVNNPGVFENWVINDIQIWSTGTSTWSSLFVNL
jgi:hypothetical protein